MCIFTGEVEKVSGTRIFGRVDEDGDQWLAYEMRLESRHELAMVLPLPVPAGVSEGAIEFVDISDCDDFFEGLQRLFPAPRALGLTGFGPQDLEASATLEVHEVGAYVASFVPRREDFERLDERFQLDASVWAALPDYGDWGFAVFQLRPGDRPIHPMALRFPSRRPERVFFPTVHVHDGEVKRRATFDHLLYAQVGDDPGSAGPWVASELRPTEAAREEAEGLLVDEPVVRRVMYGELHNADVWL